MKRLALAAALFLVGCGNTYDLDTVRQFFANNKIGNSPDFAIMQDDAHVITVHGYDDDLVMCLSIVEMLKADAPLGEFNCVPLNT